MRKITHLVIHCSATNEGIDHDVNEIAKWHRKRGFKTIGYHYVVRLDGTVETGRKEEVVGAHVEGHNATTIGICYVGGLGVDGKPKDTRTDAQKKSLSALLCDLSQRYPKAVVCGHRDFSVDIDGDGVIERHEWMKACPSFDAKTEYASL